MMMMIPYSDNRSIQLLSQSLGLLTMHISQLTANCSQVWMILYACRPFLLETPVPLFINALNQVCDDLDMHNA